MSKFEMKIKQARRRSMRRWVRAVRFAGNIGFAIVGACCVWLFAAVALS